VSKIPLFLDKGQRLFVGIDMHKKSWTVTIRTRDQEVQTVTMPATGEALMRWLQGFAGHPLQAVYEAGYFGYWLHDYLQSRGIDCVVTPPSLIPEAPGNRVKTDKKDSRKLARCLANAELKRIYVPTPAERAAREVSRRRRQLIGDRMRVQCRIKAALTAAGLALPMPRGKWSTQFRANLGLITLHDHWATQSYQELLTEYDQLCLQVKRQTQLLERLASSEPYRERALLLCTLPGVGLILAMEFLLELQDVSRFRTAKALAAYLGLTPSQNSSGEHVRLGAITRTGKPRLRGMLVEGSWRAIATDAGLRHRYEQLKARIGAKRAAVAIARHLALTARRLLLDHRPYQAAASVAD
jgi:transposase